MPSPFADVLPLDARIDREMTYEVPEDLANGLRIGSRVLVPLGVRWTTGIVVGQPDRCELDGLKSVGLLLDPHPVVSPRALALCRWIAGYYVCSLASVLKAALPAGIHTASGQRFALEDRDRVSEDLLTLPQRAVLEQVQASGSATLRQIERRLGNGQTRTAVTNLVRRGLLRTYQEMRRPRVRPKRERTVELIPKDEKWMELELPGIERRAPKQGECLRRLWSSGGKLRSAELREIGIGPGVERALAARNLVQFGYEEVMRDPYADLESTPEEAPDLTSSQAEALARIRERLDGGSYRCHLLHGVTGSGKTRVYLDAAAHALKQGRGVLALVPEISLTPQTVRHFKARFGDRVAVLHSRLSEGERYDAWREVLRGHRPVVVGTRSAVFAPVRNLGLIVVDEEHDASYKQTDRSPRYHARDVALMRGSMEGACVVLGSATPSLESFHNASTGKFDLLTLPERVDARPLPDVTLVDLKKERGQVISHALREMMLDRLGKGERIILLQNRRGYAPFVQCADCGKAIECRVCQVTLTYHAQVQRLVCHYCGVSEMPPRVCGSCGGTRLERYGVGTQRVEETLEQQFPGARVIRMDVDTTRRKGAHDHLLEAFRRGEADILLGTQMVAKGLDFPGVTLVGVVSGDTAIHLPDFRAGERTFQMLVQVSGRAGRGEVPGEVVVQTYLPDGEAIRFARRHDFLSFARRELEARKGLGYPPFWRLALLLFRGRDEEAVMRSAETCAAKLRRGLPSKVRLLGPAQAPVGRIKGYYRWQIMLQSPSAANLNATVRDARGRFGERSGHRRSGVRLEIDIDPTSLL